MTDLRGKLKGRDHGRYRHGMAGSQIYNRWNGMLNRCRNPKHIAYRLYGARGVKVCERWLDFKNFWEDMHNTFSEGMTIDRIDTNGDYTPENCRWATPKENNRNKRTTLFVEFNGERMPLVELCERAGMKYNTVRTRLLLSRMTPEEAVGRPLHKSRWH